MLQTPLKHEANDVENNPAETKHGVQTDVSGVDLWLKNAWDRAKRAADTIARLREEKAQLEAKVTSLEEEVVRLKEVLAKSEEAVKSIPTVQGDHSFLSNGEREQLSVRVKELLAKLDGYV